MLDEEETRASVDDVSVSDVVSVAMVGQHSRGGGEGGDFGSWREGGEKWNSPFVVQFIVPL